MTDYYPNTSPDDSRWVWTRSADSRYNDPAKGWQLLGVNPDAPVRYGYVVMAGLGPASPNTPDPAFTKPPALTAPATGVAWFVAGARNEHISSSFKPSLAVTVSYDSTIYWENEAD